MPSCLGSGAMSGLLRPVGPAPTQTYWARRALVFGPAVSVLAIAVVLISNGTSSGTAAQTKSARGGICRFPDYEHETGQAAREGLG